MCKQGKMEEEFINCFGTTMKEYRADRSQHITKITMHIPTLVTPCQNEILNKLVAIGGGSDVLNGGREGAGTRWFHFEFFPSLL